MRTKRGFTSVTVAVTMLSVMLCSIAPLVSAQNSGPIYGGTVYVSGGGIGPWSDNFNPFSPTAVDPATIGLIYQTLIYWNNANNSLVPFLASGWKFVNSTYLVINLRQDIKWNDGTPFSASDVVFTFDLLKKYPALDTYGVWSVLSKVYAINSSSVAFVFSKPAVPYLYYIGVEVPIVAEHAWANISNPVTYNNPDPVATGPFTVYYFSSQEYVLKKNPYYWVKGRPYINYIVVVAAPSNTQAYMDLLSGKYSYVPMYAPNLNKTWVSPDPQYHYYWFPPVAGYQYVLLNDEVYPLSIPSVRQAIAYAINHTAIDSIAESGYMPPVLAIGINQYEWPNWVNQTLATEYKYSYNIARAKQILSGLGFKMVNGVLQTPNGTSLTFNYIVPAGFTDWVSAAQLIKSDLAQIGIQVNIEGTSTTQWITSIEDGSYDMSMYTVVNGPTPFYAFNSLLNSNLTAPIGKTASGDFERFYNSTVNSLLEKWFTTTSTTEQLRIASKIEQIFGQQLPVIPDVARVPFGIFNTTVYTGWPSPTDPYSSSEPWMQNDGMGVIFSSIYLRPQYASLASQTPSIVAPVSVVYPSLTLSVSPTSVTAGTPVTLTATATFPNGTAASGYSVGFFANGAGIGTATTSSSGVATLTYTPTTAGTYTLTADLTSHTSTTSSPTTLTVTAKVTPPPTSTNYALYYDIAGLVVVIIVVVAVVLALSKKGKKGPRQPQQK
ncbi:MAG: ABC transporter substrate-binding protein [Thermoprotei archaeon]